MKIVRRVSTHIKLDSRTFGGTTPRTYLGMSGGGEPCQRKRWYGFHWCKLKTHSARTERIFNIGHLFEQIAISDLKDIGCEVYRMKDGEKIELTGKVGEEQEELYGFTGHEGGHPDGRVIGLVEAPKSEHLLELKTMKEEFFKKLVKDGVEKNNPGYYSQMQRYMHAMRLTRALFIAINKNTCEYHVERIYYEKQHAEDLVRKETGIIVTDSPPAKHYPEGFYKCGDAWCAFSEICKGDEDPLENCRTCDHVDIEQDGKWICSNKKAIKEDFKTEPIGDGFVLPRKIQLTGCSFYKRGWEL